VGDHLVKGIHKEDNIIFSFNTQSISQSLKIYLAPFKIYS